MIEPWQRIVINARVEPWQRTSAATPSTAPIGMWRYAAAAGEPWQRYATVPPLSAEPWQAKKVG